MIVAVQTIMFFRESLFSALARFLSPYYLKIKSSLTDVRVGSDNEEEDDEVFAEYDDEKGVVFYPPVYIQRYAAVSDCLMDERWKGKLEKIVDLGYHDMSFIKYLKDLPGVSCILGVDIETIPLKCSSDLLGCEDYAPKRESPLQVTLFQGNAADPDYRLIGCDAVVAIEMIEHMLPHDLERLVHTIFGFIKPWIAIITTPNGDFNVLFKSMQKNGLRRLDHFFEWSREQFHDWCSNIVIRYPQFTVHCQGIGPGPTGTAHIGCCSQMALFINKCYVKQKDLDLNCLAQVPKIPSPTDGVSELSGFTTPVLDESRMICPQNQNLESVSKSFVYSQESCITLLIASALSDPIYNLEYRDQTSQCNLDIERAKSFLMFNEEEMCLPMLVPRRKKNGKVYLIEDINRRLNCTTFQVTKFSKTAHNLIAKNGVDSFAREVVDEIRHLTSMLNWKKDMAVQQRDGHIWCNINWGDNAPYWNQYYQVVREYNYPFEVKNDESRILDLISEEISRLIDSCNNRNVAGALKIHIPLEHLMFVVRHITRDVNRVVDILEWNGYEVVDNAVVYSRMAVDTTSVSSTDDVDWPELDTSSELETIDQSSTVTETSATPDYHGRLLRRALDKKVKGLREMLSADGDITTELDKIVCRLMKLALRSSKGQQAPPPTKWMQCKLFDLLTLTEKAISRRKRHYLESMQTKPIGWTENPEEFKNRFKKCSGYLRKELIENYSDLVENFDKHQLYDPLEFGFEDQMEDSKPDSFDYQKDFSNDECKSAVFVDNDAGLDPSCQLAEYSSLERSNENVTVEKINVTENTVTATDDFKHQHISRQRTSESNICKKVSRKLTSPTALRKQVKKVTANGAIYGIKTRRAIMTAGRNKKLRPTASKPIPNSLIELCHPELGSVIDPEVSIYQKDAQKEEDGPKRKRHQTKDDVTEESVILNIDMDNLEESEDFHNLIGKDSQVDSTELQDISRYFVQEHKQKTENGESQTIFLNDINEPSTSKGIRHVSMDVQCGTDSMPSHEVVKTSASGTGMRIDSVAKVTSVNSVNVGTSDFDDANSKRKPIALFSKGIKIGDSVENLITEEQNLDFVTFSNGDVGQDKCFSTNGATTFSRIATKEHVSYINSSKAKLDNLETLTKNIIEEHDKTRNGVNPPESAFCDGTKFKDSAEPEKVDLEECRSMSQSSAYPDPDDFSAAQPDNSLSNLLMNFTESTDFRSSLSGSPDICSKSSKDNISTKPEFGDLQTCHNFYMVTTGLEKNEINPSSVDRSPVVITGAKMIDFINDPLVEQKSDIHYTTFAQPELCKLISPRARVTETTKINGELYHTVNRIKDSVDICNPTVLVRGQYNTGIAHQFDIKQFGTLAEISGSNAKSKQGNEVSKLGQKKALGFMVTDYDENVLKKVEFSTTRVELFSEAQVCSPQLSQITNVSPNYEITEIENPEYNRESSHVNLSKVLRKLSCACVHIHSYKQSLEDIVYQGDWIELIQSSQRRYPENTMVWKKSHQANAVVAKSSRGSTVIAKKVPDVPTRKRRFNESVSKRSKNLCVEKKVEIKLEPIKTVQGRITRPTKQKQDTITRPTQIKKIVRNDATKLTDNKPLTKVSSKIMTKQLTRQPINEWPHRDESGTELIITHRHQSQPCKTERHSAHSTASKTSKTLRAVKNTYSTNQVSKESENESGYGKRINVDSKYLPGYLRRRKLISKKSNLDTSSDSGKTMIISKSVPVKIGDTKNIILEKHIQPRCTNYMVFRNELEQGNSTAKYSRPADSNKRSNRKIDTHLRSSSPISQNSSTCSTIDSISTVKPNINWSKKANRRPVVSNNSSTGNTDSDSSPTTRIKKLVRRSKIKITDSKDLENKENIPQSSKKCGLNKDGLTNGKGAFAGRSKVYMMRQKPLPLAESSGCSKLQILNKSNVKLPAAEYNDDKKISKVAAVLRKQSAQSNDLLDLDSSSREISNVVLLVETQSVKDHIDENVEGELSRLPGNDPGPAKVTDSQILSNFLESTEHLTEREVNNNAILPSMGQTMEERLNFIGSSLTESIDVSFDVNRDSEDNSSVHSYKTIVNVGTAHNDSTKSEIENVTNHSIDKVLVSESHASLSEGKVQKADSDLLSFKSFNSTSRLTDYFMADSDRNQETSAASTSVQQRRAGSVFDIFEGTGISTSQIASEGFSSQVVSAYSMNIESMIGDQPDISPYTASISDIDSLTLDCTRQTSEELFVSGRSTPSFSSCLVDDEVPVPDWLFQVMSPHVVIPARQQRPDPVNLVDSETGSLAQGYRRVPIVEGDDEAQELLPLPMPAEPVYDMNGNMLEPGIGLGAGAGDGRGMHSNHSPDSSGRGSSLSSSDASSGPQSEAIIIDPSTFTTQYDMFHEPVGSSTAVTTLAIPTEHSRRGRPESEGMNTSRNETLRSSRVLASDGEADVSSTDTDIPDSS